MRRNVLCAQQNRRSQLAWSLAHIFPSQERVSTADPCCRLTKRTVRVSKIRLKIDVDNNQDLSIQYGVRNIPTLILLDETGEVKGR
ncbi:MAG: thioredoxin family protein, partial [Ilumatobacteraceae bacterium]